MSTMTEALLLPESRARICCFSKSEIKDEDLKDCRLFQAGSLQHCLQALLWRLRSMPWPEQKNWASMVGFDINYRNLIWKDDKDACTEEGTVCFEICGFPEAF